MRIDARGVLVAGDALGRLASTTLHGADVLHQSLPTGVDLVRPLTCTSLEKNSSVFYSEAPKEPLKSRSFMRVKFCRTSGPDGLPAIDFQSEKGAAVLSDCLIQCGLLDLQQASRAVALMGQLDGGKWRHYKGTEDEDLGRTWPEYTIYSYHLAYLSAADRLPGFLLPGASSTNVEISAEAVSHGWCVDSRPHVEQAHLDVAGNVYLLHKATTRVTHSWMPLCMRTLLSVTALYRDLRPDACRAVITGPAWVSRISWAPRLLSHCPQDE